MALCGIRKNWTGDGRKEHDETERLQLQPLVLSVLVGADVHFHLTMDRPIGGNDENVS